MYIAIISLFLVLVVSILITRIAALALMFTGLSRESARFQARSALSGVGFTTKEAETVVAHPVRRRIIMGLMLVGSVGIPTVIATSVASALIISRNPSWWVSLLLFGLGVAAILTLSWNRWVEKHLNRFFVWGLNKWAHIDVRDYVSLLQLQNGFAVTELILAPDNWLVGKSIEEAGLAKEGVLVLGIQQSDGSYLGTPAADNRMQAKDTLILYGRMARIKELNLRNRNSGDRAHRLAVDEHLSRVAEDPFEEAGSGEAS